MNYKKIATGISWVLHPFLLPVYLMAVLLTMTAFSHYPPNVTVSYTQLDVYKRQGIYSL